MDTIGLHDCFSTNEIVMDEALGLCAEGQGGKLIDEGATDYGVWVVNPSGGLISKGTSPRCDRPRAVCGA